MLFFIRCACILVSLPIVATNEDANDSVLGLRLTASTTTPFVGQEVTIRMSVDRLDSPTISPTQLRLQIPFLMQDLPWKLPIEQWLCAQSTWGEKDVLMINEWPVPIRRSAGSSFSFEWTMIPKRAGQISLAPAKLHSDTESVSSNALEINIQHILAPVFEHSGINLGVGDLHMDADISPSKVTLGEMAMLNLSISGTGPLEAVQRPDLSDLPEFVNFTIENAGETWAANSRTFRYWLQPRRDGKFSINSLIYHVFNHDTRAYATRVTQPIELSVALPGRAPLVQPVFPNPIPERLKLLRADSSMLESEHIWPSPMSFWIILAAPPLIPFVAWLWRQRLRSPAWRARWATNRALSRLRRVQTDPRLGAAEIEGIYSDFLRECDSRDAVDSQVEPHFTSLDEYCRAARYGKPGLVSHETLLSEARRAVTSGLAIAPAAIVIGLIATSWTLGNNSEAHQIVSTEPSASSRLTIAQALFDNGQYAESLAQYESVSEVGTMNGRFLFNLGNLYFLNNHLPDAILAYRLARSRMSLNRKLQENLADARGHVVYSPWLSPTEVRPWYVNLSRPLQVRIALGLYVVSWLALLLVGATPPWKKLAAVIVGLLLSGMLLADVAWAEHRDSHHPIIVVTQDETVLRKGNGRSYPVQTVNELPVKLNHGVEARILTARPNGWVQVKLPNGTIGWLPRERLIFFDCRNVAPIFNLCESSHKSRSSPAE